MTRATATLIVAMLLTLLAESASPPARAQTIRVIRERSNGTAVNRPTTQQDAASAMALPAPATEAPAPVAKPEVMAVPPPAALRAALSAVAGSPRPDASSNAFGSLVAAPVGQLAGLLQSPPPADPAARRAVALALGRHADGPSARAVLAGLLDDPDADVRRAAVWGLNSAREAWAAQALLHRVGVDPESDIRIAAMQSIAPASACEAAVVVAVASEQASIRLAAVQLVSRRSLMGRQQRVRWLRPLMQDPDESVRASAAAALARTAELKFDFEAAAPPARRAAQLVALDAAIARWLDDRYTAGRLAPIPPAVGAAAVPTEPANADEASRLILLYSRSNASQRPAIERAIVSLGASALVPLKLAVTADDLETRQMAGRLSRRLRWQVVLPPQFHDQIDSLTSADWKTRLAAVEKLNDSGGQVVNALAECLSDPHVVIRQRAVDGLAALSARVPLQAALFDEEAQIRIQAIDLLTKMAQSEEASQKAVAADILPLLDDPDEQVRSTVVMALGRMSYAKSLPAVAEALIRMLDSEQWRVRAEAAEAVGRLELGQAAPKLLELLDDPDPFVKNKAAAAIANVNFDGAEDVLIAGVASRKIAPSALGNIRYRQNTDKLARQLVEHWNKGDRNARLALLPLAEQLTNSPAVAGLIAAELDGADPEAATRLIRTLGHFEGHAASFADRVLPWLDSPNLPTVDAAAGFLQYRPNPAMIRRGLAMLDDPSPPRRLLALRMLAMRTDQPSLDTLYALSRSDDAETRIEAIGLLAFRQTGVHTTGNVPAVHKGYYAAAAKLAGPLPPRLAERLTDALADADRTVRTLAAVYLYAGDVQRQRARDVLFDSLTHSNQRLWPLASLGFEIGPRDPEAERFLIQLGDKQDTLDHQVLRVLAAHPSPDALAAMKRYLQKIQDKKAFVQLLLASGDAEAAKLASSQIGQLQEYQRADLLADLAKRPDGVGRGVILQSFASTSFESYYFRGVVEALLDNDAEWAGELLVEIDAKHGKKLNEVIGYTPREALLPARLMRASPNNAELATKLLSSPRNRTAVIAVLAGKPLSPVQLDVVTKLAVSDDPATRLAANTLVAALPEEQFRQRVLPLLKDVAPDRLAGAFARFREQPQLLAESIDLLTAAAASQPAIADWLLPAVWNRHRETGITAAQLDEYHRISPLLSARAAALFCRDAAVAGWLLDKARTADEPAIAQTAALEAIESRLLAPPDDWLTMVDAALAEPDADGALAAVGALAARATPEQLTARAATMLGHSQLRVRIESAGCVLRATAGEGQLADQARAVYAAALADAATPLGLKLLAARTINRLADRPSQRELAKLIAHDNPELRVLAIEALAATDRPAFVAGIASLKLNDLPDNRILALAGDDHVVLDRLLAACVSQMPNGTYRASEIVHDSSVRDWPELSKAARQSLPVGPLLIRLTLGDADPAATLAARGADGLRAAYLAHGRWDDQMLRQLSTKKTSTLFGGSDGWSDAQRRSKFAKAFAIAPDARIREAALALADRTATEDDYILQSDHVSGLAMLIALRTLPPAEMVRRVTAAFEESENRTAHLKPFLLGRYIDDPAIQAAATTLSNAGPLSSEDSLARDLALMIEAGYFGRLPHNAQTINAATLAQMTNSPVRRELARRPDLLSTLPPQEGLRSAEAAPLLLKQLLDPPARKSYVLRMSKWNEQWDEDVEPFDPTADDARTLTSASLRVYRYRSNATLDGDVVDANPIAAFIRRTVPADEQVRLLREALGEPSRVKRVNAIRLATDLHRPELLDTLKAIATDRAALNPTDAASPPRGAGPAASQQAEQDDHGPRAIDVALDAAWAVAVLGGPDDLAVIRQARAAASPAARRELNIILACCGDGEAAEYLRGELGQARLLLYAGGRIRLPHVPPDPSQDGLFSDDDETPAATLPEVDGRTWLQEQAGLVIAPLAACGVEPVTRLAAQWQLPENLNYVPALGDVYWVEPPTARRPRSLMELLTVDVLNMPGRALELADVDNGLAWLNGPLATEQSAADRTGLSFAHKATSPAEVARLWRQWLQDNRDASADDIWRQAGDSNVELLNHDDWLIRIAAVRRLEAMTFRRWDNPPGQDREGWRKFQAEARQWWQAHRAGGREAAFAEAAARLPQLDSPALAALGLDKTERLLVVGACDGEPGLMQESQRRIVASPLPRRWAMLRAVAMVGSVDAWWWGRAEAESLVERFLPMQPALWPPQPTTQPRRD